MISCARFPRAARPEKSASARSSCTHSPVASPSAAVTATSCSVSSPPPNAPSAPKSTSFTRNAWPSPVASGVQMSMRKWVMPLASIGAEVNSIPAKARPVYFLAAFPAISTSSTLAWSQSADQVSTAASS